MFVNPSFFDGDIVIRQRLMTPDVVFHKEQKKKLVSLKAHISNQFEDAINGKDPITKDWLKDVVDRYNHPEKYHVVPVEEQKKTIYQIINEYCNNSDRQLAESHTKMYRVLSRMIARYVGYVRATDKDVTLRNQRIYRHSNGLLLCLWNSVPNGFQIGLSDLIPFINGYINRCAHLCSSND